MHPQLQANKPVVDMTARWFFTEIVPELLQARAAAAALPPGRIAFGVRGESRWILDLARGEVVEDAVNEDVQLTLSLNPDHFTRLLKGTLDVPAALAAGHLAVVGDPSLLPAVALALRPTE